MRPLTLWSPWSMLKTTLNLRDNININNYNNSKAFIENKVKGYILINECNDRIYLSMKVSKI